MAAAEVAPVRADLRPCMLIGWRGPGGGRICDPPGRGGQWLGQARPAAMAGRTMSH
jgi:hypothetical protein